MGPIFRTVWMLSLGGVLLAACDLQIPNFRIIPAPTPPPDVATPGPRAVTPSPSPMVSPSPGSNASPTPGPAPSTRTVSFGQDITPELSASCAGCHSPGGSGARSLTLFDGQGRVKRSTVENTLDEILSQLDRGRMPPGGSTTASQALRDALRAWEDAGTP